MITASACSNWVFFFFSFFFFAGGLRKGTICFCNPSEWDWLNDIYPGLSSFCWNMCISLKLHLGWTDVQWIVCVCLCGSNKGLVASRLLLAGHWELTVWMWGDYVFTAGPVFTSAERMQRGGFGFGLVNLPARGLYLETVWVSLCVSVCVCMCGVCVCVRVCVWLSSVSTSTLLTDHPHHSAYWLCELIFGSMFSILMYSVTWCCWLSVCGRGALLFCLPKALIYFSCEVVKRCFGWSRVCQMWSSWLSHMVSEAHGEPATHW